MFSAKLLVKPDFLEKIMGDYGTLALLCNPEISSGKFQSLQGQVKCDCQDESTKHRSSVYLISQK